MFKVKEEEGKTSKENDKDVMQIINCKYYQETKQAERGDEWLQ